MCDLSFARCSVKKLLSSKSARSGSSCVCFKTQKKGVTRPRSHHGGSNALVRSARSQNTLQSPNRPLARLSFVAGVSRSEESRDMRRVVRALSRWDATCHTMCVSQTCQRGSLPGKYISRDCRWGRRDGRRWRHTVSRSKCRSGA